MKHGAIFAIFITLIIMAYHSASHKEINQNLVNKLHLDMNEKDLQKNFGSPVKKNRNQLTFVLDDSSILKVTLRDGIVTSALVKFHRPIKIEDPIMRSLSLVQMDHDLLSNEKPSWFFAGKPEDGHIYKITHDGFVESLTWVPPFTYSNHQPKHLQALLRDFHSKQLSKL